jgi:hypothetical protein
LIFFVRLARSTVTDCNDRRLGGLDAQLLSAHMGWRASAVGMFPAPARAETRHALFGIALLAHLFAQAPSSLRVEDPGHSEMNGILQGTA